MSTRPIGVYDSGVGGLTVLQVLQQHLPHENFVYFADTAHLPYGNKTPEQIKEYTHEILRWMQDIADVKMIVAACHTSSAIALPDLASQFTMPIIGTIDPLLNVLPDNGIGIIATPAAANSRMHEHIFRHHGFTSPIVAIGCPDFVPLIEEGLETGHLNTTLLKKRAEEYLKPFYTQPLHTLIYGCTHYPLISSIIENVLPQNIRCIDPAEAITKKVVQTLQDRHLLNAKNFKPSIKFECNTDQAVFQQKLRRALGLKI